MAKKAKKTEISTIKSDSEQATGLFVNGQVVCAGCYEGNPKDIDPDNLISAMEAMEQDLICAECKQLLTMFICATCNREISDPDDVVSFRKTKKMYHSCCVPLTHCKR